MKNEKCIWNKNMKIFASWAINFSMNLVSEVNMENILKFSQQLENLVFFNFPLLLNERTWQFAFKVSHFPCKIKFHLCIVENYSPLFWNNKKKNTLTRFFCRMEIEFQKTLRWPFSLKNISQLDIHENWKKNLNFILLQE